MCDLTPLVSLENASLKKSSQAQLLLKILVLKYCTYNDKKSNFKGIRIAVAKPILSRLLYLIYHLLSDF